MDEIEIQKATADDAAVVHGLLAALEASLGATSKITRKQEDLEEFGFSDDPWFEALIAWRGAEPVGLVVYFREFSTWRGSPGVYVQDFYVSKAARRSGLGSRLMDAVFEHTRDWGVRYCRLTVHSDNRGAQAFYRRLGFKHAEDECTFMLDKQ